MKTFLLSVVLFFAFVSSAHAICVSRTSQSATEACINLGGGFACVQYADLKTGNPGKQAVQLQDILQGMMDERQTLASIPSDDPDKIIDPAQPTQFHGDVDGKTDIPTLDRNYLIGRCAIVEVIPVDGSLRFSLRYSRP